MLLPKKITGTKKWILTLVIVALFGLIGYLVYDNFLSDVIRPDNTTKINIEPLVVPTINTKFETDFLSQEPYINLKENGTLPVKAGKTGRPNPFLAIPFSILD